MLLLGTKDAYRGKNTVHGEAEIKMRLIGRQGFKLRDGRKRAMNS